MADQNQKSAPENQEAKCPIEAAMEAAKKAAELTKIRSREYLELLDEFLSVLGLDRGGAVIGGSLALYIQDMPVKGIHDIDIEVTATEKVKSLLIAMAAATASPQDKSYLEGKKQGNMERFDVIYKGVKINVWLVPNIEVRPYMYKDYFKFASIMSILRYKLSYKRPKDIEYFQVITSTLFEFLKK